MASAGVLSDETSVGAPQYSQAEMDAIVDEAHRWGKKVAAHAHGTEAIKMAIRAGVDSVEHASLIDDEGLKMAEDSAAPILVFDVYNDDYILAEYAKLGVSARRRSTRSARRPRAARELPQGGQAGVKMAFGTDAGVYPHGWNAKQFAQGSAVGHDPDAGDPFGDDRRGRPDRLEGQGRRGRARATTPT